MLDLFCLRDLVVSSDAVPDSSFLRESLEKATFVN